jgi:hypothetical protein
MVPTARCRAKCHIENKWLLRRTPPIYGSRSGQIMGSVTHKDTQGVGYCGRFHGGLLRKYPQLVESPSARPTGYFHFSL